MESEKTARSFEQTRDYREELNHVGGVNDELGGVDPRADETLIRLSGGN